VKPDQFRFVERIFPLLEHEQAAVGLLVEEPQATVQFPEVLSRRLSAVS
jgi:hypothetical protein